jgi:hypothetical protein
MSVTVIMQYQSDSRNRASMSHLRMFVLHLRPIPVFGRENRRTIINTTLQMYKRIPVTEIRKTLHCCVELCLRLFDLYNCCVLHPYIERLSTLIPPDICCEQENRTATELIHEHSKTLHIAIHDPQQATLI